MMTSYGSHLYLSSSFSSGHPAAHFARYVHPIDPRRFSLMKQKVFCDEQRLKLRSKTTHKRMQALEVQKFKYTLAVLSVSPLTHHFQTSRAGIWAVPHFYPRAAAVERAPHPKRSSFVRVHWFCCSTRAHAFSQNAASTSECQLGKPVSTTCQQRHRKHPTERKGERPFNSPSLSLYT